MAVSEQPVVGNSLLDPPSGEIIATGVTVEDYMARYAEAHCELVEGVVVKMSPIHIRHDRIVLYLRMLLAVYVELKPVGKVVGEPFVMRLPAFPNRRREPDIQVILDSNPHELKDTYMDGPADLCIEVVSEDSTGRDHGEKYHEYETGGVSEYWIIDPLREECRFHRLNEWGRYQRCMEDAAGHFQTPLLPGLVLHVPTLWQNELPGPTAITRAVTAMVEALDTDE
jgi:Uma2 family endonuclease